VCGSVSLGPAERKREKGRREREERKGGASHRGEGGRRADSLTSILVYRHISCVGTMTEATIDRATPGEEFTCNRETDEESRYSLSRREGCSLDISLRGWSCAAVPLPPGREKYVPGERSTSLYGCYMGAPSL